jgi:hypothetical protein
MSGIYGEFKNRGYDGPIQSAYLLDMYNYHDLYPNISQSMRNFHLTGNHHKFFNYDYDGLELNLIGYKKNEMTHVPQIIRNNKLISSLINKYDKVISKLDKFNDQQNYLIRADIFFDHNEQVDHIEILEYLDIKALHEAFKCKTCMKIPYIPYHESKTNNIICKKCDIYANIVNYSMKSILEQFKIKCTSCDWTGMYNDFEKHKSNSHKIECQLCKETISVKDMNDHKNKCEFRSVYCELCRTYGPNKYYETHKNKFCKIKCQLCDEKVCVTEMHTHLNFFCSKMTGECTMCKKEVLMADSRIHEEECSEKLMNCTHCHNMFPKSKLRKHENYECSVNENAKKAKKMHLSHLLDKNLIDKQEEREKQNKKFLRKYGKL